MLSLDLAPAGPGATGAVGGMAAVEADGGTPNPCTGSVVEDPTSGAPAAALGHQARHRPIAVSLLGQGTEGMRPCVAAGAPWARPTPLPVSGKFRRKHASL